MARPTNDEFDIGITVAELTNTQKAVIKTRYKKKRISMKVLAQAVADGLIKPKPPFNPYEFRFGNNVVFKTDLRGEHTGMFCKYIEEPHNNRIIIDYWYEGGHHFAVTDDAVRRA